MLSVIIPSYNETGIIQCTADALRKILTSAEIPYELIFVDDGSQDTTWREIENASNIDSHVRGVGFSRNFGKEAAIFSGLSFSKGECCAVIDCDLQHPPDKLVEMYRLWQQGWEVVNGVKINRGSESIAHKWAARCFYGLISRAIKMDMSRSSDYKLMDRKVVDTLLSLSERETFFRALVGWVGYRSIDVEYSVQERVNGTTHFSTGSLIRYAISNITAYSSAPMQIITILGSVFLVISIFLGFQTLFNWYRGNATDGFTTVIVLLLLIGSIIMIGLGIIGYYISKIFVECKARPRYLIARHCGKLEC